MSLQNEQCLSVCSCHFPLLFTFSKWGKLLFDFSDCRIFEGICVETIWIYWPLTKIWACNYLTLHEKTQEGLNMESFVLSSPLPWNRREKWTQAYHPKKDALTTLFSMWILQYAGSWQFFHIPGLWRQQEDCTFLKTEI